MSTRTPLNILAARVKALEATIGDIKREYEQWLEAAQDFEHALSTTVEKLECATDDLWSIEIETPTDDPIAPQPLEVPGGPVWHAALPRSTRSHQLSPPNLDDEIPF